MNKVSRQISINNNFSSGYQNETKYLKISLLPIIVYKREKHYPAIGGSYTISYLFIRWMVWDIKYSVTKESQDNE